MAFLKTYSIEDSISLLTRLSRECKKLGGPLSNQLYQLVRDQRFVELVDFQIDYTWAFTVDDFLYARQIKALFEKQVDLFKYSDVSPRDNAVSKFLLSEDMCRETNRRLESGESPNGDVSAVMYYAMQKISSILGDVPSISSLDMSFGPGANTSTKSRIACPRTKLSSRLECGMNLLPLVAELLSELPRLCECHHEYETDESWLVEVAIVPGKLGFVPKNCKTFRSIVIESGLGGLVQKGFGRFIKERLRLCGVDLKDQSRNQTLARKGSLDGSLATLDLSMASDCVSRELVWSLLPYEWASILDICRSAVVNTSLDGKVENIELQKFSSMGNAYTFELESLIFFALTWAVCKHLKISKENISVYGDDIICPVEAYPLLCETLVYCGFSVNSEKSFAHGPFRESCGADYFLGMDIRPFYLKSGISERILYTMHNWFLRHGEHVLAKFVFSFTHPKLRLFGPDSYGDGHLIGHYSLSRNREERRDGWEAGTFKTYTLKKKSYNAPLRGDYLVPGYTAYISSLSLSDNDTESEDFDQYTVRGTDGYVVKSIRTLATKIFFRDCVPEPKSSF